MNVAADDDQCLRHPEALRCDVEPPGEMRAQIQSCLTRSLRFEDEGLGKLLLAPTDEWRRGDGRYRCAVRHVVNEQAHSNRSGGSRCRNQNRESGKPCKTRELSALGGDLLGAAIPFLTGVGAAIRAGRHADDAVKVVDDIAESARALAGDASQTFEILDGVRRSKSADLVGNKTIPAEIIDAQQRNLGVTDLPIDSLLSPKSSIDISTSREADRFFRNNLDRARAGSVPPPITVTSGSRGIPIRDVVLDPYGDL